MLGRNGGDEFCILLPNHTCEDAKELLRKFTMAPKTFSCKGKEHPFYISLGYAEYPTSASSRSQLMRCADAALYEIKLHGKNGCMAYKEGLQSGIRKQLGFAFKDISEHLPGAFIIYKADKGDDELFYANHEFLRMGGYQNMDELFRLTKKSFRNLIREDEQQQIEASIWKQIDSGNENDYIHFHLRKADGSYHFCAGSRTARGESAIRKRILCIVRGPGGRAHSLQRKIYCAGAFLNSLQVIL